MTDFRGRFGSDELPSAEGAESPIELDRSLAMGRDLDAMASREQPVPSAAFVHRVVAAIDAEPLPRPAVLAGQALRRGSLPALLASIRDARRVAFSGGRPLALRAQALALVAIAALAVGSLGSAAAV